MNKREYEERYGYDYDGCGRFVRPRICSECGRMGDHAPNCPNAPDEPEQEEE